MPIDVRVDTKLMRRAFDESPSLLNANSKKALTLYATKFTAEFIKSNMSVHDDRMAADIPLHRRPVHSKGLVRRSGALARGLGFTISGRKASEMAIAIGWKNKTQARIARVQELGTVGRGGKLPDIRPKRGAFLAIPLRSTRSAFGKSKGVAYVRKVRIPPRLGLKKAEQSNKWRLYLKTLMRGAVKLTIQGRRG